MRKKLCKYPENEEVLIFARKNYTNLECMYIHPRAYDAPSMIDSAYYTNVERLNTSDGDFSDQRLCPRISHLKRCLEPYRRGRAV